MASHHHVVPESTSFQTNMSGGSHHQGERHGLLQHGYSPTQLAAYRSRSSTRPHAEPGSVILPAVGNAFLHERHDHKQMLSWQDGDDLPPEQPEEAVSPGASKMYEAPTICGLDQRPFFPASLGFMLLWSMCMMNHQAYVIEEWFGSAHTWSQFCIFVYTVTLACLAYLSLCDPGLMDKKTFEKWEAGQLPLPARARKHWLYRRPVLRFDHYCRWTTGVIGLYNHRQFIVFVAGLVVCASMDTFVDVLCLLHHLYEGSSMTLLVMAHFVASGFAAWYTLPLLRQHTGFICRNELANDWKDDRYTIVRDSSGQKISVHDLDEEEFDEREDEFEYDPEMNPYDKGLAENLRKFWMTPRWDIHKINLGDF
eukprot:TRINITY_DN81147_c0_g1_i1.p1 TRINITY_DN81147_c0_g1~~TRINITY_DN81147_c0_g1_i1.p1  ORF type:complete len:367 (-),score=64.89 TRINITY_DN81147_c0_g1_i1:16-1116(-)